MFFTIIDEYTDFLKLEQAWNELLDGNHYKHVCLTFEWFKAWWHGFGPGTRPAVIVYRDKGAIAGIVPLMAGYSRHRGIPVRSVSFMENGHSPCCDFLIRRHPEDIILKTISFINSCGIRWDILRLNNLPSVSPAALVLSETLRRSGLKFGAQEGLRSPYITVRTDWNTYFQSRSKKFRKVLRNKLNRIEKIGTVSISCAAEPDTEGNLLDTVFRISARSWKGRCGQDMAASPAVRRFFTSLTNEAARKGWLQIWLLHLDGRPIAYEYHLKYGDTVYGLRADYDEAFGEYSPGSVLDYHIVKNIFDHKMRVYDMCGSNDFYKTHWTSDVQEHVRFSSFSDRCYGRFLYALEFKAIHELKKIGIVRHWAGKRGTT